MRVERSGNTYPYPHIVNDMHVTHFNLYIIHYFSSSSSTATGNWTPLPMSILSSPSLGIPRMLSIPSYPKSVVSTVMILLCTHDMILSDQTKLITLSTHLHLSSLQTIVATPTPTSSQSTPTNSPPTMTKLKPSSKNTFTTRKKSVISSEDLDSLTYATKKMSGFVSISRRGI